MNYCPYFCRLNLTKMRSITEPVQLTPNAVSKIKLILKEKKIPSFYGLRIGIMGGGCVGVQTNVLGFDVLKETDETWTQEGITLIIDKRQIMFLAGTTIDYIKDQNEQGFIFEK